MKGGLDTPVPVPPMLDLFWSWLGAFLGILLVGGLNQWLASNYNLPLLIASFGASAVLIFGAVDSKLAQPRNFIGGQVLSAVVGCIVHLVLGRIVWLSGAVGMSLALLAMMLTKTTHPPGGATALIASAINPTEKWQGFFFVLSVTVGSIGMLIVALLVNNLHHQNRYPTFWF
ncbi:hypothetical protein WJX81_000814 [Elliptochloris bilobata]|uniref:HPP transmembrane region domain-containing protein n=1 Tax=Elliptochloris bilobata TaxID=381761 RepID=A0AAW1S0B5_9CHLO